VRGPSNDPALLGQIQEISTPKVNVSNEQVNAITANFSYVFGIGRFGDLSLQTSYSNVLKHEYQAASCCGTRSTAPTSRPRSTAR
jgi:hypothetical protein